MTIFERYPTAGGSTVDISIDLVGISAACAACPATYSPRNNRKTRHWAQEHAKECRAFPIGTRVTIRSVRHLGRLLRPTRILGRTGTVTGHTKRGMHEVSGLSNAEPWRGCWLFAAEHLDRA